MVLWKKPHLKLQSLVLWLCMLYVSASIPVRSQTYTRVYHLKGDYLLRITNQNKDSLLHFYLLKDNASKELFTE